VVAGQACVEHRGLAPLGPAAAAVATAERRGRTSGSQTKTLSSIQTQISSLAQNTGPLAWIEVGGF